MCPHHVSLLSSQQTFKTCQEKNPQKFSNKQNQIFLLKKNWSNSARSSLQNDGHLLAISEHENGDGDGREGRYGGSGGFFFFFFFPENREDEGDAPSVLPRYLPTHLPTQARVHGWERYFETSIIFNSIHPQWQFLPPTYLPIFCRWETVLQHSLCLGNYSSTMTDFSIDNRPPPPPGGGGGGF